jgi:tetratricopeptide (TPR) repeat protein
MRTAGGKAGGEGSAAILGRIRQFRHLLLVALLTTVVVWTGVRAGDVQSPGPVDAALNEAYRLFYVGRYEDAAKLASELQAGTPDPLGAYELRTSALHFRLKRELFGASDKKAKLRACVPCTGWIADMKTDIAAGRALAKERLQKNALDDEALFYLGKINLTHVWLHLETLGQRTGWGEYWEARRSLDALLERHPGHIRARVSRAWIDYVLDTRVPFVFRWVLGGGDKKKALAVAREAASEPADTYTHTEARFTLWEMLVREKRRDEAVVVARSLSADFPENTELVKFIEGK